MVWLNLTDMSYERSDMSYGFCRILTKLHLSTCAAWVGLGSSKWKEITLGSRYNLYKRDLIAASIWFHIILTFSFLFSFEMLFLVFWLHLALSLCWLNSNGSSSGTIIPVPFSFPRRRIIFSSLSLFPDCFDAHPFLRSTNCLMILTSRCWWWAD